MDKGYEHSQILSKLKEEYKIKDETYYIEIHPNTPQDGVNLVKKFGTNVENIYDRLRLNGKQFGIGFGKMKLLSNSHKVTILSEIAREKNKLEKFSDAVFYTYFEECFDIGKDEVIKKIVEKAGLDWKEVAELIKKEKYINLAKRNQVNSSKVGVNGVPHFIINGKKISGAQPLKSFRKIFDEFEISKKK